MANKCIFDTPVHKGLWYICLCGNNFSLKKSPPCLTAACLLKNIFDRMNSISVVAILQWSKNATKLVLVSWILGYDEYDFFCNFKRFDCFPSSGTQGLPPPVRAFLVAGLDLSTRAWRDARSPSCRPCGRPLTLTHTRTRTGTALGGALGLSLTWRERVTTHEPLSIHPCPGCVYTGKIGRKNHISHSSIL